MLVSLDGYLMLLLWQFHLDPVQVLAVALTTITVGECEAAGERESAAETQSLRKVTKN